MRGTDGRRGLSSGGDISIIAPAPFCLFRDSVLLVALMLKTAAYSLKSGLVSRRGASARGMLWRHTGANKCPPPRISTPGAAGRIRNVRHCHRGSGAVSAADVQHGQFLARLIK